MSFRDILTNLHIILKENEGGIGSILLKQELELRLQIHISLPQWDQWLRDLASKRKIFFKDLGAGGVVYHLEDKFYKTDTYTRSEFQREIGYKKPGGEAAESGSS